METEIDPAYFIDYSNYSKSQIDILLEQNKYKDAFHDLVDLLGKSNMKDRDDIIVYYNDFIYKNLTPLSRLHRHYRK
jgi:hypothetical protein